MKFDEATSSRVVISGIGKDIIVSGACTVRKENSSLIIIRRQIDKVLSQSGIVDYSCSADRQYPCAGNAVAAANRDGVRVRTGRENDAVDLSVIVRIRVAPERDVGISSSCKGRNVGRPIWNGGWRPIGGGKPIVARRS